MMRFLSRLGSIEARVAGMAGPLAYESVVSFDSKTLAGVRFAVNRVSLGRRMELSKRVREISQRAEFLGASNEVQEKIEGSILAQQIDAMYLHWGLVRIEGLTIDGEIATTAHLIERGPEELTREIVGTIKGQCGLSEAEQKN